MSDRSDQEARLDKQAQAIKRLRKDRDALRAEVDDLKGQVAFLMTVAGHSPGAMPSTVSGNMAPEQGVARAADVLDWKACLMCKGTKPSSRAAMLTCKPCGAAYQAQFKAGGVKVMRLHCARCGMEKSEGTALLCSPCRAEHKAYVGAIS